MSSSAIFESRRTHGANILTPPPREPWWRLYFSKFDDPVIRILLIAAAVSVAVGIAESKWSEGVGIVAAILLATGLAYWNESRAGRAFDLLSTAEDDVPVKVLRDGVRSIIPRKEVVVGDCVRVEAGDEVPADGQLFETVSLAVNEARLTGESLPVEKSADAASNADNASVSDRLCRGTVATDGFGEMIVSAVGDATELGRTARAAAVSVAIETPLNRQLAGLAKVIGVVGLAVASLVFAALVVRNALDGHIALKAGGWLVAGAGFAGVAVALVHVWLPIVYDGLALFGGPDQPPRWTKHGGWPGSFFAGVVLATLAVAGGIAEGVVSPKPSEWMPVAAAHEFLTAFMVAVTIVVVAVPEGLAMSVTLSLAYSMRRMAKSNILVRRMHACETIGAATVICSDKTGTLTRNDMRVVGDLPSDEGLRTILIEAIASNTTAHLSRRQGQVATAVGNPTDTALLLWLDSNNVDYVAARDAFPIETQWPFRTDRKFMATSGGGVLHAKGAPEILLARCDRIATPTGDEPLTDADTILAALKTQQARGMRTLGFAVRRDMPGGLKEIDIAARKMTWLGSVAIADPVRTDVPAAIAACRAAGVRVMIVTGDTSETAVEVGREIGLWDETPPTGTLLTGPQFAALSDAEAGTAANQLAVLARARPADKLRLVDLLRARGEVVAVTGDGVNDGPALNHADVGLAMAEKGSAVAKEASDILLLDDSFASVVTAVRWGRGLYENIQRFILYQLTINVTALALAVIGPLAGTALPLTVLQMLWINLIMDTFAALALATEPPDARVMTRSPRVASAFIITRPMAYRIFAPAAAFLAILIVLLIWLPTVGLALDDGAPSRGGTILFTVFVLLQFWNLFNARRFGGYRSAFGGVFHTGWFPTIAAAIFGGQLLIVEFGGAVFRTVPLSATDWLAIIAGTSLVLAIGELLRWRQRRSPAKLPSARPGSA